MVWAGISKRGATDIVIFDGVMEKGFYMKEILANSYIPFAKLAYGSPENCVLMQDNGKLLPF